MELSVDVVLYQQQDLLGHFLAIAVDQLDAVIVVGIMAGRNHDATVEVVHAGDIGHGRGGGNVKQVGIRTGSGQTCYQTILKHIRTATGVLTNDNTSRVGVAVTLTQSVIIPAQKTAYLVGMVSGQSDSSFTTEAIGSKVLSHYVIGPHPKSDLTNICFSREVSSLPAAHHGEVAHLSSTAM